MKEKYVAVAGGSNVDIQGFSAEKMNFRDSNPGRIRLCPGGVGRNIAENLARMGTAVKMISVVGDDHFGRIILRSCSDSGVDTADIEVLADYSSSTYLVLTDQDGDMFTAVSDMHIIKEMGRDFIRRHARTLEGAAAIVIDPNLSADSLDELTETYFSKPIFADPISITYAGVMKPFLSRLYMVKCNRYEAEVLSGNSIEKESDLSSAAEKILSTGLKNIVITLGAEGSLYADAFGRVIRCKPEEVVLSKSATGAGDAFTAGMVYGMIHRMTPETSLSLAGRAAVMALSHEMTVNPNMTPAVLGLGENNL